MTRVPIALQLYTVRDETARDFRGTVRKVGAMGYAGVEFAGTGGVPAPEMADLLHDSGLKAVGAHVPIETFERDLDTQIAYFQALGAPYIGIPWLPRELQSAPGYRLLAAYMNRIGRDARSAGITLYYHNHAFEFDALGETRGLDILLGETDPALVTFEIDCFWVHSVGIKPAELIASHAGRFALIHLKDMTAGTAETRTFAEVGEGVIDWQPVFAASEAQGATWYVVEQDRCARPTLQSAALSLANLKRWGKG
jgi:sugar phosphate isomerase/epimerase